MAYFASTKTGSKLGVAGVPLGDCNKCSRVDCSGCGGPLNGVPMGALPKPSAQQYFYATPSYSREHVFYKPLKAQSVFGAEDKSVTEKLIELTRKFGSNVAAWIKGKNVGDIAAEILAARDQAAADIHMASRLHHEGKMTLADREAWIIKLNRVVTDANANYLAVTRTQPPPLSGLGVIQVPIAIAGSIAIAVIGATAIYSVFKFLGDSYATHKAFSKAATEGMTPKEKGEYFVAQTKALKEGEAKGGWLAQTLVPILKPVGIMATIGVGLYFGVPIVMKLLAKRA